MVYLFMWLGCWSNPVMRTQPSFCVYLYLFYAIGDPNVRWMYIYNCYIVSLSVPLLMIFSIFSKIFSSSQHFLTVTKSFLCCCFGQDWQFSFITASSLAPCLYGHISCICCLPVMLQVLSCTPTPPSIKIWALCLYMNTLCTCLCRAFLFGLPFAWNAPPTVCPLFLLRLIHPPSSRMLGSEVGKELHSYCGLLCAIDRLCCSNASILNVCSLLCLQLHS